MALLAKELCALILWWALPKPVAATSPRLKLMTLAGGVRAFKFTVSMTGVEKGLAGVVAPLGTMLFELPWRSCVRMCPGVDPRG